MAIIEPAAAPNSSGWSQFISKARELCIPIRHAFTKERKTTQHNEISEQAKIDKIKKILEENLPPNLAKMVLSDKRLVGANGEIQPVFYSEVMTGYSDDLVAVPIGPVVSVLTVPDPTVVDVESHMFIDITKVKVRAVKPWEKLFNEYPSLKKPAETPEETNYVVSVTFVNPKVSGEFVRHYVKKDTVVAPTADAIVGAIETRAAIAFQRAYDKEIDVKDTDANKVYIKLWEERKAKKDAYNEKHPHKIDPQVGTDYNNPYDSGFYADVADVNYDPVVQEGALKKILYLKGHKIHKAVESVFSHS